MTCLEAVGVLTRTELAQQPGRDAVAKTARWTLSSVKPVPVVIDTFAAAHKLPSEGHNSMRQILTDEFSAVSTLLLYVGHAEPFT